MSTENPSDTSWDRTIDLTSLGGHSIDNNKNLTYVSLMKISCRQYGHYWEFVHFLKLSLKRRVRVRGNVLMNVVLKRVRVIIVASEKQPILHFMCLGP